MGGGRRANMRPQTRCLSERKRKRENTPHPKPPRDPFEKCGLYDEVGHEIVRDALERWFGASNARISMVSARAAGFFDMACVTMIGPAFNCEDAYVAWAANEVASGATNRSLRDLANRNFQWEWDPVGLFRTFLKEARIVLPDTAVLLVFFAVQIARDIASRSIPAKQGAAVLTAIADSNAGDAFSSTLNDGTVVRELPPVFGRIRLLSQGIMPDTYEPLFDSPVVDERIRTEAQALIDAWAARVVTSDDPKDWRSRLR